MPDDGMAGLVDRSLPPRQLPPPDGRRRSRPASWSCAGPIPAWGPRRIVHELGLEGVEPVPGRSSVYRALIRHGLLDPSKRRRRRSDYKRWERSRSMELWQMDVVGPHPPGRRHRAVTR